MNKKGIAGKDTDSRKKNSADNGIHTTTDAKQIIAARLREILKSKPPHPERELERIEVRIVEQDLLFWLKGVEDQTKLYFSGRHQDADQVAGIGKADWIHINTTSLNDTTGDTFDYNSIFKYMNLRLQSGHPGLRYYGGVAFATGHIDEDWKSFGNGCFIMPRFELAVRDGCFYLACNITPEKTSRDEINRLLHQLEKMTFRTFSDGESSPQTSALPGNPIFEDQSNVLGLLISRKNYPEYQQWKHNISKAVADIRQGIYKKTVLARKVVLEFEHLLDPLAVLDKLRRLPDNRYDFLFQLDSGPVFLGSSPERLYRRMGRMIESEAVAGTRIRGTGAGDDVLLAKELMDSDKEQREHDFVIDTIEDQLHEMCRSLVVDREKGLLKLKEGQHIVSYLNGELKEDVSDELLLQVLHPTPAVGGCPLSEALRVISLSEPFKRGWYSGVVGMVASDSTDFAVALRSGLIDENRLSLFSGVGVVDGSDPDAEWRELDQKITNFMELI